MTDRGTTNMNETVINETVFLVIKYYRFEGDEILGIFRKYEDAIKFAEKHKGDIIIQERIVQ